MSDALRELEVETTGFYLAAGPDNPKPARPDEVRPYPLTRVYSGDVLAVLNLTTRDACILSRQLESGRSAPRQAAALAATLKAEREAR